MNVISLIKDPMCACMQCIQRTCIRQYSCIRALQCASQQISPSYALPCSSFRSGQDREIVHTHTLSRSRTHANHIIHVQVLRSVTDAVRQDSDLRNKFENIPHPSSFCDEDVDSVFQKYTARVETLFGNEVARQLMEKLKKVRHRV